MCHQVIKVGDGYEPASERPEDKALAERLRKARVYRETKDGLEEEPSTCTDAPDKDDQ